MTYTRPPCEMCGRGADILTSDGAFCARHSEEGYEALTYHCSGCGIARHPDLLDNDGFCGPCAYRARDIDDAALSDRAIGDV